jgi:hypothetical protein
MLEQERTWLMSASMSVGVISTVDPKGLEGVLPEGGEAYVLLATTTKELICGGGRH